MAVLEIHGLSVNLSHVPRDLTLQLKQLQTVPDEQLSVNLFQSSTQVFLKTE